MNVLVLYGATQTFTNAVYEHLCALKSHSRHNIWFIGMGSRSDLPCDLTSFDAIIVHYSLRLPFNQISGRVAEELARFPGMKALFIQDDYDYTGRACYWMRRCGFDVVFTVVPAPSVSRVYTPDLIPGIEFVSVLTGYADNLHRPASDCPPSRRPVVIGYRGRELPLQYGQLGREKAIIGKRVKEYCDSNGIVSDIAWTNDKRIYGEEWYSFIERCRACLGSESGCNVFDWDGDLALRLADFARAHPDASEEETYESIIAPLEMPGLMNQISPRCFEAAALRSVLVLSEGTYSGVLKPNVHFIPLKKDFSNLAEVFNRLANDRLCDEMAERTHADIVASGAYSYRSLVRQVEHHLNAAAARKGRTLVHEAGGQTCGAPAVSRSSKITEWPVRAIEPAWEVRTARDAIFRAKGAHDLSRRLAYYSWGRIPPGLRERLRPKLRWLLGYG
jgi:hypothetical protein